MKVRWTNNSVRFRITPTELAALERSERVLEELCLPPGKGWRAVIVPGVGPTSFVFEAGELRVLLSDTDRRQLMEPDKEGVYFRLDGETTFRYFIEKDFPCTHPRTAEGFEPITETFAP